MPLFRKEAMDARRVRSLGDVLLVRPLPLTVFVTIATAFLLALVFFFFFGHYTKRQVVKGYVEPSGGVVAVYAQRAGVVVKRMVEEGSAVRRGDVLLVLSVERHGGKTASVDSLIVENASKRQQSLQAELEKTRQLQRDELAALATKKQSLEKQLRELTGQAASRRQMIRLGEENLQRMEALAQKSFISSEQLARSKTALLEKTAELQEVERDRLATEQQATAAEVEQRTAPTRQQNQLAQLERALSAVEQEIAEGDASREIRVIATADGVATAISAEIGQYVEPTRPALLIVPQSGGELNARLFVPANAIGFMAIGDRVKLRYHALPYQSFGYGHGSVFALSKAPVNVADLPGNAPRLAGMDVMPVFIAHVRLDEQELHADQMQRPIRIGMTLDADVLQETRRIYQWAIAPLSELGNH